MTSKTSKYAQAVSFGNQLALSERLCGGFSTAQFDQIVMSFALAITNNNARMTTIRALRETVVDAHRDAQRLFEHTDANVAQ